MLSHRLNEEEYRQIKESNVYPFWIDPKSENVYQCRSTTTTDGKTLHTLEKICRFITVSKILCSLDNDKVQIELKFLTSFGLTKTVTVDRQDLTKKRFEVLTGKGIDINDRNCANVLEYLSRAENNASYEIHHTKLGWYKMDDLWTYRLYRSIGAPNESLYDGEIDLKPQGSLAVWKDMIQQEVLGHPPLELLLVAGLSAMLVPRLKSVSGYDSLFIHLSGDSSIGKTTAEMLAISAFANPISGGLMKRWTATQNALIASFDGNLGLPIAIDESSAAQMNDFTSFIYMFSQGHGRERAKSDGTLRTAGQWSFTLISSGEAKLPRNGNSGLNIRLLELSNMEFTNSAENADNIRRVISQNYGHAAILLAEHLVKTSDQDLVNEFWDIRGQILGQMSKDKFSDRTANRITILVQAACHINIALGLGLNIEAIALLLINLDHNQERDIGAKALDAVTQYFTSHFGNFSCDTQNSNTFQCGSIGTYKDCGTYIEIAVLTQELRKILGQLDFKDIEVILSRWKETGVLDCEADRFTRKRKICFVKTAVYVLKISK